MPPSVRGATDRTSPVPQASTRARAPAAGYGPGDCLFISPRGVRHGRAPAAQSLAGRLVDGSLVQAARPLFRDRDERALLAGVIPFDPSARSQLGVYRLAAGDVAARDPRPLAPGGLAVGPHQVLACRSTPTRAGYRHAVQALVERMRAGELDKAVLGRVVTLDCQTVIDPSLLLARLVARHPQAHCFAVPSDPTAPPGGTTASFLGASPELLVARRGLAVLAHPMAGSRPRSRDPRQDARRAEALVRSPKDLHEHRLVVDAVVQALRPLTRALQVPAGPSLVRTPSMWHLATPIRGDLRDAHTTALDLVAALHPTPAVCGAPRAEAMQALAELEGVARGPFAGAVGYCDGRGDGEWAVAIRCAEIQGRRARLFAGAGIVAGSDPQQEYAETQAKLCTMLHALGLQAEPEA